MQKALKSEHDSHLRPALNLDEISLDETDQQIIAQLTASPSMSNVDIANQIKASASTVANRLQNLFDRDVIKIIARLDIKMLGCTRLGMVRINLSSSAVIDALRQQPNVLVVAKASITNRLFVIVAFNDFSSLRKQLYTLLAEHAPGATCAINECTEIIKYDFNAAAFNNADASQSLTTSYHQTIKQHCDDTDYEILNRITFDARQSNRQIAREMELSENTVRKRIGALIDKQLIKIGTVINSRIQFSSHLVFEGELNVPPAHYEHVVNKLKQHEGVHFLAHATGSKNLVFNIIFQNQHELEQFSSDLDKYVAEKHLYMIHPAPEVFRQQFLYIT